LKNSAERVFLHSNGLLEDLLLCIRIDQRETIGGKIRGNGRPGKTCPLPLPRLTFDVLRNASFLILASQSEVVVSIKGFVHPQQHT
jgi:hypothetical protein